jgi:hypothetical protein
MSTEIKDTPNGKAFERWIWDLLDKNQLNYQIEYEADGLNKEFSKIDVVLLDSIENPLEAISLKYQEVGGTADEKICFEANSLSLMCLAHGMQRGTIVLAGPGWQQTKYYWYLNEYQPPSNVRIISYDEFVQEYIVN